MPRTARASIGDIAYHVINRGNGRSAVFHQDGDFRWATPTPAAPRVPPAARVRCAS